MSIGSTSAIFVCRVVPGRFVLLRMRSIGARLLNNSASNDSCPAAYKNTVHPIFFFNFLTTNTSLKACVNCEL